MRNERERFKKVSTKKAVITMFQEIKHAYTDTGRVIRELRSINDQNEKEVHKHFMEHARSARGLYFHIGALGYFLTHPTDFDFAASLGERYTKSQI